MCQQPAANNATYIGTSYACLLNAAAFWLQPVVMNVDVFPYTMEVPLLSLIAPKAVTQKEKERKVNSGENILVDFPALTYVPLVYILPDLLRSLCGQYNPLYDIVLKAKGSTHHIMQQKPGKDKPFSSVLNQVACISHIFRIQLHVFDTLSDPTSFR